MKKITDMTPEERRLAQILAETIDERISKAVDRFWNHFWVCMVIILVVWGLYKLFWAGSPAD